MKLYYLIDGPPSIAVRMLLKKLDLKHELHLVDFVAGEHMSEAFIKMNPQKEIPVLDDNGFYLSEGNAILQYLMDKYAPNSDLYPRDAQKRALVNHRLCFNLGFLYPAINAYAVLPTYFSYAYERTSQNLKRLEMAMGVFEEYMKRTGEKYVAGDSLTIADFPLINSVMCLEAISFDLNAYPLVQNWYESFKKQHPDLWDLVADGLQIVKACVENPPDTSGLNHPLHPAKKIKT